MANGYLGKISAVVSANTADFQNKLNAAAKDVQKFASSMQGSLTSAQSSSSAALRGIYTDAQKLERALTAISTRKLSFRGFADKDIDSAVGRMRALYSATEQINKPLTDAAKGFGKLPAEIQGAFLPALISAQKAAESLADEINRTGKVSEQRFGAVAAKVEQTTAAMSRLKEASALVSGLATGKELSFQRPEMVAETRRSASLQSDIGKLSPDSIRGYAELVAQQRVAAIETERLAAALEKAKLSRSGDVAAATAAYQSQLSVQRQLNDEIERRVTTESEASKRAAAAADAEIAILQRRAQAQKAAEQERQAMAQRAADAEIAILQRRAQAQKAAEQERQAQARRAEDAEIAILQRRAQAQKAAEIERQAQAQKVADGEIATLIRVQQAAKAAEQERQAQVQRAADAEIAVLQRRAQAEKAAEQERQSIAQRAADAEIAVLQRRAQAEKAAEQERQSRVQSAADAEIAILQRRAQAQKAAEQERQAQSQRAADAEIAVLQRRAQAEKAAESGGQMGLRLGLDIEAPVRQLDVLGGEITSLKSQIDAMPDGLRTRFAPAIREAETEFRRLASAPAALPGEIESARQRLIHLTQDAARASQAMSFARSFGGEGVTGVNLGLDQRALQGYNAQLQILQGYMSRIPAEVSGPAVAAFNQLRNAIAAAFDGGTLNTAETRRELAGLLQATAQTTAALAGVSAGRIGRDIQRAGDIGRRGFDNMSLALNQAAFAIDDFMSSTGGLEFKLRAISNNITQLAFILGGTRGLFVGLGAVIAGQAAVGLIKWINNGRTAEDQTKALNEALARQKSLVEELAEAFRSLGESATRGIFSEQAQQAKDFARDVENILKKQRELGVQRVVGNDPTIQRERAEQAKLRREIEKEENPAVRAGKQQQLRASEEREQRRTQLLGVQPPPSAAEIRREVRRRAPVPFRNAAEGIPEGEDVASRVAQADAIRPAVDRLKEIVSEGNSSFDFGRFEIASRQLEVLGGILDRLDRAIGDAVAQAATDVAKASRGPAEQIRQAQEEVAKAIELGLPGARLFGEELNNSAEQLEKAYKKLENAASGKDEKGREIGPSDQKALVDAARAEIDDLNNRSREIAAQTDALAYGRIVDPQRQIDARMERARGNLNAAGLEDGRISRRMREIDAEREQIRRRAALPEFQTPEMVRGLQDAEDALNEEAAAIEAATISIKIFAESLDRASEEVRGNLNSAQQRADEARREDLANSTPQTRESLKQAEAGLAAQRQIDRKAQTEIAVERDRLEQMQKPAADRVRAIEERLKGGEELRPGEREGLIREREALRAQMQDDALSSQKKQDSLRNASTAEDEFQKAAARGRELGVTEVEKRRQEAAAIGNDISARASQIESDRARSEFIKDATRNAFREAAPALVAMDEQFNNALREPSRARLEAADINTQQGQSELNRLLRGDDEAKNQNLEVLNKQLGKLEEIKQAVINSTGQVVN